MKSLDMTGQTFGRLTVLKQDRTERNGSTYKVYWLCRCVCGNEKAYNGKYLRNGDTKSCGCWDREAKRMRRLGKKFGPSAHRLELTGKKFGKLTVVQFSRVINQRGHWLCKCDCGKDCEIATFRLTSGHTQSCGCKITEVLTIRNTTVLQKHGLANTSEYSTWNGMKRRCFCKEDEAYPNYGGRGITVCERWVNSFEDFYYDMGLKPSLDHSIERINNNGNYEPSNCKWATATEQSLNRRPKCKTGRTPLTFQGETLYMAGWARKLGISSALISTRVRKGLPIEKILATLPKRDGRKPLRD